MLELCNDLYITYRLQYHNLHCIEQYTIIIKNKEVLFKKDENSWCLYKAFFSKI